MVTVNIFHDLRRIKNNGLYPVKLRITYNRRSKYFETGIDLTKENYHKLSSRRIGQELISVKNELIEFESKANAIIRTIRPFNFPVFSERFSQKTYDEAYVELLFNETIAKLKAQGKVGTDDNYQSSISSLRSFKKNLRYEDINDVFLYQYEQCMLNRKLSITTVGIYCRSLRAIFNEAIYRKIISRDYYPF